MLTTCHFVLWMATFLPGAHPLAAPGVTSLTNPAVTYRELSEHHVVLQRGNVRTIVVDNEPLSIPDCPNHRAGYNGLASLTHTRRQENLFVPTYAGLNLEHIHDGTVTSVMREKFEPRVSPCRLRQVDEHTVEVYQPPSKHHQLESCGRYQILEDGTIEYTFECIPRAATYRRGYIGLFWASYIHQPESLDIHFQGVSVDKPDGESAWIRGVTARHGVDSTHPPRLLARQPGGLDLAHDADFPLSLVYNRSRHLTSESWYYGVSHGMALVQMFRPRDQIWFAQSPSGGGMGNPAWDFQWFIPDYRIGEAYGFTMRCAYLPFESLEQLQVVTKPHRDALRR